MSIRIRPRADADVDALVEMTEEVRRRDGYPGEGTDLRSFLVSSDALAAWVAVVDGAIAGHVALHSSSLPVVMDAAAAIAEPPFGVVARLLVSPTARRCGVGRALLDVAADEARRRSLRPILDVVTAYAPAIGLYEAAGWTNTGEVTMHFDDGVTLQSYVFVSPAAPHVRIRTVEASPTAVVAGGMDLSAFMARLDAVYEFLRGGTDVQQTGQNVALYGTDRMEVGVEVDRVFEPVGDVRASMLPAGRAATATHTTGYADLGRTYAAIAAWCAEHGHTTAGIQWEVYGDPDGRDHVDVDVYYLLV